LLFFLADASGFLNCKELAMPSPMTAPQVLNREFLEVRAKILELAASLDRLDRSDGSAADDPRLGRIREGLEILLSNRPDRAERVQLLFSRDYDESWRKKFGV
jgi:hypothetical protein